MKIIAQCSVLPPEMKILPALVKIPGNIESEPPTAALYSTRKLEPAPNIPRTITPATPRAAQCGPGSHLPLM